MPLKSAMEKKNCGRAAERSFTEAWQGCLSFEKRRLQMIWMSKNEYHIHNMVGVYTIFRQNINISTGIYINGNEQ
jgi:hypothetical protein